VESVENRETEDWDLTRNKQVIERVLLAVLLSVAVGVFTPAASATPMGLLATANCPGGGVTVSATMIDWSPAGAGGCTVTGDPTNVTHTGTGGPALLPGVTGTIQDLTFGVTMLPVANFMTFPGLSFTLTTIGPGPSTTNCAGLTAFQTCAAFAGSPFGLQLLPDNTTSVVLPVTGTVTDSTGTSTWIGAFTQPVSDLTPAQLQTLINAGGSKTTTYAGHFTITAGQTIVPEPATLSSILLGGLLVAGGLFRRRSVR
jgi:hypothetical protein